MEPIELQNYGRGSFLTHRFTWMTCGVAAVAVVGYALFGSAPEDRSRSRAEVSPAERQLVVELQNLRSAWREPERQRILDRASEMAQRFVGPMGRILRSSSHPYLREAVEYAGPMGDSSLAPVLAAIALSSASLGPEARVLAMHSAEALQPWSNEDLTSLLAAGPVPLRLAAIEITKSRPNPPWELILAIIKAPPESDEISVDDWQSLKETAIAAISPSLPEVLCEELWSHVQIAEPLQAAACIRALARTAPNVKRQRRLLGHFDQLRGEAVVAALELLGEWGQALPDDNPVWTLAIQNHTDLPLRLQAMYCLERCAGFEPDRLRDVLPAMPDAVRLAGARCLLSRQEASGFAELVDLLDSSEQIRARQLLAWLTGRGPGAGEDEFLAEQDAAVQRMRQRRLPAPTFGGIPAAPR